MTLNHVEGLACHYLMRKSCSLSLYDRRNYIPIFEKLDGIFDKKLQKCQICNLKGPTATKNTSKFSK